MDKRKLWDPNCEK